MMLTVIFLNGILLNTVAVVLLLLAWKQPRVAKLLFSVLFGASALANIMVMITGSNGFNINEGRALTWYNDVIMGGGISWVPAFLILFQLAIAVSILLRGWFYIAGVIAAIILLGTIIPLGTQAAFPATFIMALALTRLLKFNHHYFWYVPRRIWS